MITVFSLIGAFQDFYISYVNLLFKRLGCESFGGVSKVYCQSFFVSKPSIELSLL